MADTESLGEAGVRFLEGLAAAARTSGGSGCRRSPTRAALISPSIAGSGSSQGWLRSSGARSQRCALGVLMTDTCINYQTIMAPVRGEHMAYGDTGVVIYSNSVLGARSNFEGGPSALAAGLTGRTPRYGYHLDACRRATRRFRLTATPRDLSEWGALGGIVGEACGSYWEVPVIEGIETVPGSDALKHFGTALASFGSVALFHMPGITAEEAMSCGIAAARDRHCAGRDRSLSRPLRGAGGQARRRRLWRAAAVAVRDRGGGARPRRAPRASRHDGPRHDLARDQARRRPDGSDAPDRSLGRGRRAGHLLLPELCPRDGRGQWLDAA